MILLFGKKDSTENVIFIKIGICDNYYSIIKLIFIYIYFIWSVTWTETKCHCANIYFIRMDQIFAWLTFHRIINFEKIDRHAKNNTQNGVIVYFILQPTLLYALARQLRTWYRICHSQAPGLQEISCATVSFQQLLPNLFFVKEYHT